ncbi:MAG TPA: TadE family protein [Acidobacteriaceae bacterium]|nr:TadE family protein [Acidobacteriaceae bacterium]
MERKTQSSDVRLGSRWHHFRSQRYKAVTRQWKGEDGSLVIETALALTVAIPMVLWLFELCMLVYTYSVLGDAARQGVRYAIVHGSDSALCSGPSSGCTDLTGANVSSVVTNAAAYSFHNLAEMNVQVTYPDNSSTPPSRVGVAIIYNYVPYIELPGIASKLQLQAQGRIVY